MAEVSFYVQEKPLKQGELAFRLCKRVAIVAKQPLLVLLPSTHVLTIFDDLLWTFDASSFLPHQIIDNNMADNASLIWLSLNVPEDFTGNCLNLTSTALPATQFSTILELITQSEDAKIVGREKFLAYRTQGINPVTHRIA